MRVLPSRPIAIATLVCGLTAPTVSACSSAPAPTRERVEAALVTSGLAEGEARCATKQLFRVLTPGQLRNLAERGSGALPDKASSALSTALGTCAVSAATTTPSSSATTLPQTAPQSSKP